MRHPKATDRSAPTHDCPVCHQRQTKIQRLLADGTHGSTNYVCARAGECVLGIDLTKVATWVAV